MNPIPTLVLPGLNGAAGMLSPFCEAAPATHHVAALDLPTNLSTYASMADHFDRRVAEGGAALLVAESFSGPLAVMLAARHPSAVRAVVLAASFVTSPMPSFARLLPWSLLLRVRVSSTAERKSMLGDDCTASQVEALRSATRAVPVRTLAGRIRQMIDADEADRLRRLTCPVVYLRAAAERRIPDRCVEAIRHQARNPTVHTIDGPHLLLENRPQAVWRHILASIDQSTYR
ncbi:MAG: hypothetical protein AAGB00_01025 [Planctomycetota bacterium]